MYIQDIEDLEEMLLSGQTLKDYLNCFHCKKSLNDEFVEWCQTKYGSLPL